jgi:SEC-C motif-containing protein
MRSRYSAFAVGSADYLKRTWHSSTRPKTVDLDDGTVWRRLQIVDSVRGAATDRDGTVEFRASYRSPEGAGLLHERSRFVRESDRWLYVDGEILG